MERMKFFSAVYNLRSRTLHIFFVTTTLALTILFMLACGVRDRDAHTIRIEFWTLQLSPTFNEYFHNLIREFEAMYPGVKVRWVDVPYDLGMQRYLKSFASGRAPDVINLSSDFLSKAISVGSLLEIEEEVLDRAGIEYLPAALETGRFRGRLFALPWYLNTYVTIYNTQLITNAGFDVSDLPLSFSEFLMVAREYYHRTGRHFFFLTIGKDSFLPMILESEGVPLLDETGTRAIFNTPAGVEVVDQWVQLFRDGALPREAISSRATAISQPFQAGLVAALFTGPVFLRHIRDNAPGIYEVTEVGAPLVGKTGRHELAVMSVGISSQTRHPDIATKFALFLTNPENQTEFARHTIIFPSTPASYDDPHFLVDSLDVSVERRAIAIAVASLPDAGRLRTHFQHPSYDRLQDIFDEAIQMACLGRMTTEEALNWAADQWNRILRAD